MLAKHCRESFDKLLKGNLLSYPIYQKSDEELLFDAMNKDSIDYLFGLFRLDGKKSKDIHIPTELTVVRSNFFPLYNLLDENKPPVEIKLSSFQFPSKFLGSLEETKSTFNNQTFNSYHEMYSVIEQFYGAKVIVTRCWPTLTSYHNINNVVNIISVDNECKTETLGQFYRNLFLREREILLKEILINPRKYMNIYDCDKVLAFTVLAEFRDVLERKLTETLNHNGNSSYYK